MPGLPSFYAFSLLKASFAIQALDDMRQLGGVQQPKLTMLVLWPYAIRLGSFRFAKVSQDEMVGIVQGLAY